jgi:hypothetical protein
MSSGAQDFGGLHLGHILRNNGDLSGRLSSNAPGSCAPDFPTLIWLLASTSIWPGPWTPSSLAEARSVDPSQPAVRVELGRAALAQGDYKRAVDHLTSALALNPEMTAIHYPLGMAYRGWAGSKRPPSTSINETSPSRRGSPRSIGPAARR